MYKLHHIIEKLGISSSTAYRQINEGLLLEPVRTGKRAVGWPKTEFDEFISQVSSGLTIDEIRNLVACFNAKRNSNRELKK